MGTGTKFGYVKELEEGLIFSQLDAWLKEYPQMGVCAFLPEAEKEKLSILQDACIKKNVPLVGGLFPSLVYKGNFETQGVLLFCLEKMPYYRLFENLSEGGEAIAKQLIDGLEKDTEETLFLLFDAMVPNIGTLLDEIYLELANRVHYMGANAGSESFQNMPCLFDETRVIGQGVLIMLLPNHKGAILEHGYHLPSQTFYATSTSGNRISQIDWKPAFEVYQEIVKNQFDVYMNKTNFYELAVHYPFGIIHANHHIVVRIPVALQDDGSLFCVGEVTENSVLTLLERPIVDSNEMLKVVIERYDSKDAQIKTHRY